MADVSLSMMVRGERVSDQAGVWEDIAAKACRLEADSPTSAMEAIFERHVGPIDEYVAGCRPVEGQVGALFFVGETLIGFDLFDRPSTLSKLLQNGSDGYRWTAATIGANNAASYQLASGEAIMAIGGFNGSDPAPTLAQFQAYVRRHAVHYFIGGGGAGGPGGSSGTSSAISTWVAANFTAETVGGVTVYDLSSATT